MSSLDSAVIDELADAQALAAAWDELAVLQSLPLCAPGWMLSWWEQMAPAEGELRIIALHEGAQLIGLAPWFVQRSERGRVDLRFLGAENSDRVDVLCRAGREHEVRAAIRAAIRTMRPRPDLVAFEAAPASSQWPRLLARGDVRLLRYRNSLLPAPSVALPEGAPEAWLEGRSSNFRSQMRRRRRG